MSTPKKSSLSADETDHRLEPADETPSRGRIIAMAVTGYLLVALVTWLFLYQPAQMGEQILSGEGNANLLADMPSPFPMAAYLAPEDDRVLTAEQRALANLRVAHDQMALATIMGVHPEIQIIYIHPAMLDELPSAWLRQQYEGGKLIAALNTPLSVLGAQLGLAVQGQDVPLAEFVSGRYAVTAVRLRSNGSPLEFTGSYAQFDQIPLVLNGLQ